MSLPQWSIYVVGLGPLVAIFVFFVISVAGGSDNRGGLISYDDTGEAVVIRDVASDFDIELFGGGSFTLADELGTRPIMVEFWGSWCHPCRREATALEAVWRQYQDRVLFVGINVFDTESRAREFIREFNITYPVGSDPRGTIAIDYGLTGVPEKHFIGANGRVVRKLVGPLNAERLSEVLDELLEIQPAKG